MNDRLRSVMLQQCMTVQALAEACAVDPKTVERWLSKSRVPHRRYRWKAAEQLGADEVYLWPAVAEQKLHRRQAESNSELVRLHLNRAAVSRDTWHKLISESEEAIDVLVFSGTFLSQMPNIGKLLADRARAGVEVRICFGDPDSQAVAMRDKEEGLEDTLAAKIRAARTYFRSITSEDNCEVRLHETTLYNSIFRFDDDLLANPHAWGQPASANPLLHFRRLDIGTGFFDHYRESFEAVWKSAVRWNPDI
ncbi:helix-turn-helix domain-containing protein [Kribbella qitaiheensis]|uniref:helix-turn-helix domain-containing protein n=1 Tax=Kribbella qitaiheensis TaxID=1544730 RepID=UPI0036120C68